MPAAVTTWCCVVLTAGHTALQSSSEVDEGEMWLSAESSVNCAQYCCAAHGNAAAAAALWHRPERTGMAAPGCQKMPDRLRTAVQQLGWTAILVVSSSRRQQGAMPSRPRLAACHTYNYSGVTAWCCALWIMLTFWNVDTSAGRYWCRVTQLQSICNQGVH